MYGFQARREALGAELRQLRAAANLSGEQLANRLGWVQPKVSRIETGKQTPSVGDVQGWVQAVGASPGTAERLLAQLRDVQAEYTTWRRLLRAGAMPHQEEILDLEVRARSIRVFESALVPGLLQTPNYARQMLGLAGGPTDFGAQDVEAMVATRMRRQQVIYEPNRSIRLIVTEAALRNRLCSLDAHLGQLDRIITVVGLPTIEVSVIPLDAELATVPQHGFNIYDRELVAVETITAELILRSPDEIELYERIFDALSGSAQHGDAAVAIVRRIMADLRRRQR